MRLVQFTAHDRLGPLTMANPGVLRKVVAVRLEFGRARPGHPSLLGGEASIISYRLAVVRLQPQAPARGCRVSRPLRRALRLVRHGDRFAEMGDRLLEG